MDRREITCIICPIGCKITVDIEGEGTIKALEGNECSRGETYVTSEILDPVRILTSIVRLKQGIQRMCPIKTSKPIPKGMIQEMAKAVSKIEVTPPIKMGEVIVQNIMGTGADIVATQEIN